MEYLSYLIDLILHLDKHLQEIVLAYGSLTYGILTLIVFCETGLVVTPILPGDSLLFAAGAIAATGGLNVHFLVLLLVGAAILGDTVNYHAGRFLGPQVFESKFRKIFKPEYLERTQHFFEKYGAKTIVIARFVPIVRTFAPFMAGVGKMNYSKFIAYNIFGAVLWVVLLTYAGFFFGGLEVIKKNFGLVTIGIIVISLLPLIREYFVSRKLKAA